MKNNTTRKQFVVDWLQYRLLLAESIHLLAVVAVVIIWTLLFPILFWGRAEMASGTFNPSVFVWIWVPLLVVFVLSLGHNVVMSHRIAGPLLRLRKVLADIGDGDLAQPVTLRRRDFLKKEASSVNSMMTGLAERVDTIRGEYLNVRAALEELRSSLETGSLVELKARADEMSESLTGLKQALDEFRTPERRARRDATAADAERSGQPVAV